MTGIFVIYVKTSSNLNIVYGIHIYLNSYTMIFQGLCILSDIPGSEFFLIFQGLCILSDIPGSVNSF